MEATSRGIVAIHRQLSPGVAGFSSSSSNMPNREPDGQSKARIWRIRLSRTTLDTSQNRYCTKPLRGRVLIRDFGCRMPSEEEPVVGVCGRPDRLARSEVRSAEHVVALPSTV